MWLREAAPGQQDDHIEVLSLALEQVPKDHLDRPMLACSEGKSRQAAASRGSIVTQCPRFSRRRMRLRVMRSGFWRV